MIGRMAFSESRKARVFIVDDHPIVREGIGALIDTQPDMAVCGEAANASDAMRALTSEDVSIAVVDISLRGADGLELIRNIKAVKPQLPVVVLSAHDESLYAERAVRAGAMGYVMKSHEQSRLIDAIRHALRGQAYVNADVMTKLALGRPGGDSNQGGTPEELLTDRELEVLRLTGQGMTTQETADALAMSPKTVQRHKDNVREKLHLENNTRLQYFAVRWVYDEEQRPS